MNDSIGGPNRLRRAAEPTARRSGTRAALFWAFALVAGLGTALLIARYLDKRGGGGNAVAVSGVVVAAMDLPLAAKLKVEDLKVIEWPADHIPPGAMSDPKELVGRVLISRVLAHAAAAARHAGGQERRQRPGRADPVEHARDRGQVDDVVGVAGFIHADDRVDVIVTLRPNYAGAESTTEGLPAEHQGAGGRARGRQRRQDPAARDARHGGDAAGVAAGRGAAGARPERRADHADAAKLDGFPAGRYQRRQPVRAGRRRSRSRRRRLHRPRRAGASVAGRRGEGGRGGPPPPPTLTAEAPAPKDTVEILRGDRFEQRNFNRGDKR